jgi:acyl carrier protein
VSSDEILARLSACLELNFQVDPARVTPDAGFRRGLGLDSLDVVDFAWFVQQEFAFEAEVSEYRDVGTVGELVAFVRRKKGWTA